MPVGAYMVVHLLTNASVLAGRDVFQDKVDKIHSLGPVLPLVEWTFIFLPIIFHAVVGVMIVRSGMSNTAQLPATRTTFATRCNGRRPGSPCSLSSITSFRCTAGFIPTGG